MRVVKAKTGKLSASRFGGKGSCHLFPWRVAHESGLNLLCPAFRSHDYLFVEHCSEDVSAELMQLRGEAHGLPTLGRGCAFFQCSQKPCLVVIFGVYKATCRVGKLLYFGRIDRLKEHDVRDGPGEFFHLGGFLGFG